MIKGYVYVLSNKSIKGVKCGYTDRDPQERCDELYNTSVPTPFKVEYSVFLYDARVLEKKIHSKLNYCRISDKREFFDINKDKLIEIIKEEIDNSNTQINEENVEKKAKSFNEYCTKSFIPYIKDLYNETKEKSTEFIKKMRENDYYYDDNRLCYNMRQEEYNHWRCDVNYLESQLIFIFEMITKLEKEFTNIKKDIGITCLILDNKWLENELNDLNKNINNIKTQLLPEIVL
jgi:hypothetical protein